jgi:Predicted transcriptional regulator
MICYTPFWNTLKIKGISTYALIKKHNISNGTLYRIRKNAPLSTVTIDALCQALDCKVEDVLVYVPSTENRPGV